MSRESAHGFAGTASPDLSVKGLAELLHVGKDLLPNSLSGSLSGFSSLGPLAGGCLWSLPCGPLPRAAHSKGEGQGGNTSKMELPVPYNLILEVTFHHFCSILFVSRYRVHSEGGESVRVWVPGGGVSGQHFRGTLPPPVYGRGVLSFCRKRISNSETLLWLTHYLTGLNLDLNQSFL